ncbi:MAG TPA: cyclic nucleotide-binding domain-containing protein [Candidatus Limnocylindrales bacterium]|nr:cyclic nucleotide-binding domain-containing protein [Candidatus Limnocylindrales bacterium]
MTVTAPDVLRSVPLFEGMTEASIESIGRLTKPIQYRSGDVLVREGDPGDSFIILLSGRADVDRGGRRIRDMSAGEFLGEVSLIDHGPRTATGDGRRADRGASSPSRGCLPVDGRRSSRSAGDPHGADPAHPAAGPSHLCQGPPTSYCSLKFAL